MKHRLATLAVLALLSSTSLSAQVDPDKSTIHLSAHTTYLNGIVKITVVPRDSGGVRLGSGQNVEINSTLGIFSGGTVDVGNGTYFRLLGGNALGTASITAKVNGTDLTESESLTVIDPAKLGAVIGIDGMGKVHSFCSIQQAINHGYCRWQWSSRYTAIRRILVAPGTYKEVLRIAYRWVPLSIEGRSVTGPIFLQGLRIYRSSRISLRYLVVGGNEANNFGVRVRASWGVNMEFSSVIGSEGPNGEKIDGLRVSCSWMHIGNCFFWKNTANGVRVGRYSRVVVARSLFDTNAGNGLSLSGRAVVTARENFLFDNGGYGIVRDRDPYGWSPRAVTLIENDLRDNNGAVVAGRSNANLGNYDLMLDSTDDQDL